MSATARVPVRRSASIPRRPARRSPRAHLYPSQTGRQPSPLGPSSRRQARALQLAHGDVAIGRSVRPSPISLDQGTSVGSAAHQLRADAPEQRRRQILVDHRFHAAQPAMAVDGHRQPAAADADNDHVGAISVVIASLSTILNGSGDDTTQRHPAASGRLSIRGREPVAGFRSRVYRGHRLRRLSERGTVRIDHDLGQQASQRGRRRSRSRGLARAVPDRPLGLGPRTSGG